MAVTYIIIIIIVLQSSYFFGQAFFDLSETRGFYKHDIIRRRRSLDRNISLKTLQNLKRFPSLSSTRMCSSESERYLQSFGELLKVENFMNCKILRNSYQILQIAINSHFLAFSQIVLIEVVFDQKVFDITQKAPIETHKNDIFLPSLIYSLLRREHKKQQKMFFMNPADLKIRDKSGSRPRMH